MTAQFDSLAQIEHAVIGAVLNKPDTLALLPELEDWDFRDFKARTAWNAIRKVEVRSSAIDIVTVGDEIERAGKLHNVGFDYLNECALACPTPDNLIEYARLLKDHRIKRRVQEVLAEVLAESRKLQPSGAELLSMALAGLATLDAEQPIETKTIGDVIKARLAQLDEIARERAEGRRTLSGFPTGVARLDDVIGGWQPGIVSIVAGRPGHGKSSLGLATADSCSSAGVGCHVFSLEDTGAAYADRALARTSHVPAESIRNCTLSSGQLDNVRRATASLLPRQGWLFDERSGITASEIVRTVRRRKKENATKVAIVDYVQLVSRPRTKLGQRMTTHELLTDTVQTFADAAKQDRIAYVVMSQLNRDLEKREDKRPMLADLRESGSLEERAKCVVGIYRGAAYGKKPKKGVDYPFDAGEPSADEFESAVQLLVLKNSNGRTGTVRAHWVGPTTRME